MFIIASEDRRWSHQIFHNYQDVYFTSEKSENDDLCNYQICRSAIRDLAILSQCNHSIITFGMLSFWSAYLKPSLDDSITILPNDHSKHPHPISILSEFIPTWEKLNDPCFVHHLVDGISNSSLCVQNGTQASL